VEKGLIAPEAQLSKEEIDNLIFAPGFSTAASITNVSGRGVGMDVVRQNVKDLGGRITIDSEEGKGTTFTLTLPLTLAISDGMIVKVGDQTLVVPLTHVVESLRPETKDVQGLGAARMMLNVRGRFIPVVSVSHAVGAVGAIERPEQGVLIVVDTESAGQAALLVDNIWDQRQFVIKSLDTHYRTVDGVAGATILGDGRVALILNVDSLVATATAPPCRPWRDGGGMSTQANLDQRAAGPAPWRHARGEPGCVWREGLQGRGATGPRGSGHHAATGQGDTGLFASGPAGARQWPRHLCRLYRDDPRQCRGAAQGSLRADHQPHVFLSRSASFRAFHEDRAPASRRDAGPQ
jgi:chemotaxis signal transduction protein